MKIYLDTCVYNRPFDDQTIDRISIETEAFLIILNKIETGEHDLVVSSVNIIENEYNPYPDRKDIINAIFSLAKIFIQVEDADIIRAEQLEFLGFKGLDALHIAVSEKAKVDYFITCDDKLVKSYRVNQNEIKVKIINVLKFLEKEVFKWD